MTLTAGVHRIVESHAAIRGTDLALIGPDNTLTYDELNQRGNALARHLIGRGFRRGSRAIVKMEACPDLVVALLAVLKAGGAYTWLDHAEKGGWPSGISLEEGIEGSEQRYFVIDIREAQAASACRAPNLPILTRAADTACVLPQPNGLPDVHVPHATITALRAQASPQSVEGASAPDALELWRPLMAGTMVMLATLSPAVAAAA